MTTNDRAAKVWKLAVSARSSSAQAGFRDGDELVGSRPASFDTFAMFIGGTDPGTGGRVAGGRLGRRPLPFSPQNLQLMKSPYQQFTFAPVTASHLKVKLLSSFKGDSYILAHEFQLFGE